MVSGKEFRANVRKPMPGAPQKKDCRIVPAFTIQSMQKNTCVLPPPKCNVMKESPLKKSTFRTYYRRGDLPIALDANRAISWKVCFNISRNYHFVVYLFFRWILRNLTIIIICQCFSKV